jgi:hypothetical protein
VLEFLDQFLGLVVGQSLLGEESDPSPPQLGRFGRLEAAAGGADAGALGGAAEGIG